MTLGAFELSHRVLVGTQLGALTPLARSTDGGRYTFDAVAGQTYWIVMAAFSPPDYTPFKITISPARP